MKRGKSDWATERLGEKLDTGTLFDALSFAQGRRRHPSTHCRLLRAGGDTETWRRGEEAMTERRTRNAERRRGSKANSPQSTQSGPLKAAPQGKIKFRGIILDLGSDFSEI